PNVCDYSDNIAIYPENTLHTAFARLNQELTDSLTFDVTAFYANRKIVGYGGALGTGALGSGATATATLAATSPFYRPVAGVTGAQTVRFNYAPLFGDLSASQRTNLESYGVAPSLAYEIGGGWQLRTNFSYGYARTSYENAQISAAAQTAALVAGTLNPYNIAGTSQAVAATLLQFDRGYGRNELFDYRAILDGPLFSLPGGEVRAAVGYEHMHDHFQRRITNATTYVQQVPTNYIQKVDSVFGELQLPIVGTDNASSFIQELTISASGRYDKYNDFGDTFNPKIGLTFKPTDWLILRGNWGKSFTAPSPVDQLGVAASTVAVVPSQFLNASPPGTTPATGEVGLFVAGTAPGLQPQKATNWSVGGELRPTFVEGLTITASYYRIDLRGTIGRPVGVSLAPFYTGFPDLYNVRPTGQQLAAYLQQFNPANVAFTVTNPTSTSQALVNGAGLVNAPVLVTLDTRARNLGTAKLSGLDFGVNYIHDTGFGSVDASFVGNYKISQKSQANLSAAIVDNLLTEIPRMNFAATLGATVGKLRGQVTWNHTSSYLRADAGSAGAFGQVRVGDFDTVNLYFRYEMPEKLLGPDLELTLNVQNLLDEAPPLYKSAGQLGFDPNQGHGFSIGRIVQIGVTKKF
ncbi:MAG: TonB-dependent receptor, partial [Zymomonas sp.]